MPKPSLDLFANPTNINNIGTGPKLQYISEFSLRLQREVS
jgi:hypothetical protein